MRAFTRSGSKPRLGLSPHLLQHRVGRPRLMLVAPDRRSRVERVRDRDDPAEQRGLARAPVGRIAAQVELHVVLVRHQHLAIGDVGEAVHVEEEEEALGRMLL